MLENAVRKLRDDIENAILSGEYGPGTKLDETLLATRFGVSRTPVREALMQLHAIGLIEQRPRRGAVVIDPGPHRIFEMFEVMGGLEAMAGGLAARRLTAESRRAIAEAHAACERSASAGDSDAYYYDNEAFHNAIYVASGNTFLEEQCVALHRRLRPYRRLQLRVTHRLASSFSEHYGIVEAIFAGDAEAARRRLYEHVSIQGEKFSHLIASLKSK